MRHTLSIAAFTLLTGMGIAPCQASDSGTDDIATTILTRADVDVTITNDGQYPWFIEGEALKSGNAGKSYTSSTFTISYRSSHTTQLTFDYLWNSGYNHPYLRYYIDNELKGTLYSSSYTTVKINLEAGEHVISFKDSLSSYNSTANLSLLKNIQVKEYDDWVNVEMSAAGTLGVEVLYQKDVLTDVTQLKVKGTLNSTDWTNLKQMTNLVELDLSEAKFDAVPYSAFSNRENLCSITLPEGVKTIGAEAFRNTSLWRISIPASITSIGSNAFQNVPLESITFSDHSQLTSIGQSAFQECRFLKSVILPNTTTSIDTQAFYQCTALETLSFSNALTAIRDNTCYGCTKLSNLHLPTQLNTIGAYAFQNTSDLHHIDFPNTLSTIQYHAFYGCAVDSVILPTTLTYLYYESFDNCRNLTYIQLPSYLQIYYQSYSSSSSYGYCRNFSNCPAIKTIVCTSATPPVISSEPFPNIDKSNVTLKVPSFAVVNYKLDTYWYQFGAIEEGDDIDYWKVTSTLSLTNNRRMNGHPDIDLYYGGRLTVGGNAPMPIGQLNFYINPTNPGLLLNTCEAITADGINTYYEVSSETWYFFTPLYDIDLSQVSVSNNASYVFRFYDGSSRAASGTGNSWKTVDGGKLIAGQGYIFRCNANATLTLPAEAPDEAQAFRTTDVTTPLTAHASSTTANKSWNYVGNPYPAYYDIYYMDFTAPITVWTGSTYKAYSIADDDLVLRPMQSFFVQKPDAVDNIIFHQEGRQLSSTIERASYAKPRQAPGSAPRHIFNLQLAAETGSDEARVVINPDASTNYELECDASKFMSLDGDVPQLFTLDTDGNGYAINERPLADGNIHLAYRTGQAGFLTLSATRADGDIYLHDHALNRTINLAAEDYTFHSEATEGSNTTRFTLALGIADETTTITSLEPTQEDAHTAIYDLQGRKLGGAPLQRGIYIQNGRKVIK